MSIRMFRLNLSGTKESIDEIVTFLPMTDLEDIGTVITSAVEETATSILIEADIDDSPNDNNGEDVKWCFTDKSSVLHQNLLEDVNVISFIEL